MFSFRIDQKMYQNIIFHIKAKLPSVLMTNKSDSKEIKNFKNKDHGNKQYINVMVQQDWSIV